MNMISPLHIGYIIEKLLTQKIVDFYIKDCMKNNVSIRIYKIVYLFDIVVDLIYKNLNFSIFLVYSFVNSKNKNTNGERLLSYYMILTK